MKQIVQNYQSGELRVEDVPAPICRAGGVLVRTAYSLVSVGTERMKVTQARMNLLAKARARPDKVRQVLQNVRHNGLFETVRKVRERLDTLTPLGYSLAGVVEQVGAGVDEFRVGDRVACAGEGIACHAEFVSVPRNLCVTVPDGVDLRDAAFATVGAIAMNGVRQAGVSLGDTVIVLGLGLVGLIGVQLLKAAGCRVIGIDLDSEKLRLAKACGADLALSRSDEALEQTVLGATGGVGADASYIAASAASSDPMELSGRIVRDRGRVVIVGMVKLAADWQVYYHKELSVVMSRSYGPGRYDSTYELKGVDYPIGYVRWTQRRNLEEFVRLVGAGAVQPSRLSPQAFPLEQAPEVYQRVHDAPGQHSAGILFSYPPDASIARTVKVAANASRKQSLRVNRTVRVALIGAGNFSTGTLIPALKATGVAELHSVCSAGGLSARSVAGRHGFDEASSDFAAVLADDMVDAVIIATRHDTHARFASDALRAGKHVFVEKPLAMDIDQLSQIDAARRESNRVVMPGFNRRFSKLSRELRNAFATRTEPIEIICRVNAGALAAESWYNDDDQAGWRIVSEGCHFIDLMRVICGQPVLRVSATLTGGTARGGQKDNCVATLDFADGSVGVLIYVGNGDAAFDKERIEVFGQGRAAVIDNWKHAEIWTGGKRRRIAPDSSAKGHHNEIAAFIDAARGGADSPLPWDEAVNTTLTTFAILESIGSGGAVEVAADVDSARERPRWGAAAFEANETEA
ncbi:MAG: bi-domain-containing oxidoreductase [Phycisphaerales bacterium]|nr:bi-domain-containing oxidoreductase [Phycisphaerales bacterium]